MKHGRHISRRQKLELSDTHLDGEGDSKSPSESLLPLSVGSVVLTDDLKQLLASLDSGANSEGQTKTGPADGVKLRSSEVDDLGADY